jgi:hypothetical protein
MATTIAEYYTDELAEWNRVIGFYNQETDEFEHKLAEVIHRNTIPHIAAKVDHEQDKLNRISRKFYRLLGQIQQQEAALKTNSAFIDDELLKAETEKQQNELRRNMQLNNPEMPGTEKDGSKNQTLAEKCAHTLILHSSRQ